MGRKRSPGLRKRANGFWHIEKQILGERLYESTGTSCLEEAELILANRIDTLRQAKIFGIQPQRTFREAATRYLQENLHLTSIATYGTCLRVLDPYIGDLTLNRVHIGTLQRFIDKRRKDGVKNRTINISLGVVRRILHLSSRLWRDEEGHPWLTTPALIQMLPLHDTRKAYPLSWDEQSALIKELPSHLARMALFKVNTGTRDQEVCRLRWEWEERIDELDISVFWIPSEFVKNRDDRILVLNRVALSVINEVRGNDPTFVFGYRGKAIYQMNNSAWKRARVAIDLPHLRVHDLKHTFGRRLRAAGVSLETRKVLLGHVNGDITSHYSAPEWEELLRAANKVCAKSGKNPALVMLRQKEKSH